MCFLNDTRRIGAHFDPSGWFVNDDFGRFFDRWLHRDIVQNDYQYVDKTEKIFDLVNNSKGGHPSFCSLHFFNIDGCRLLAVSR